MPLGRKVMCCWLRLCRAGSKLVSCGFLLFPGADGGEDLRGLRLVQRDVGGYGDPAGCYSVIGVGLAAQVGVGSFDHVGQVRGQVVALRDDLYRFAVLFAVRFLAHHAEVDDPAMRNVAHGVDDLAHADQFEVLPVDQHLLAAGVDVHHGGMVGPDQRPTGPLQPGAHVVRLTLAHWIARLLAAPASIASTNRSAVR